MAFPNNPVNNQAWSEGGRQYRYNASLPGWQLSGAAGGDQDWGGNRLVNLEDGVDPNDAVNLKQLQERAMRAGDLGGTVASTLVEKIQGQNVAATPAPTNGQDLRWDGTAWAAATNTVTLTGDVTASGDASPATGVATSVEKIRGSNVSATAPTSNNQFLKWNQGATQWEPTFIQSLQNRGVANAVPNQNDVLAYIGTQWQPVAAGAGLTDSPPTPENVTYGRVRKPGDTANIWEQVVPFLMDNMALGPIAPQIGATNQPSGMKIRVPFLDGTVHLRFTVRCFQSSGAAWDIVFAGQLGGTGASRVWSNTEAILAGNANAATKTIHMGRDPDDYPYVYIVGSYNNYNVVIVDVMVGGVVLSDIGTGWVISQAANDVTNFPVDGRQVDSRTISSMNRPRFRTVVASTSLSVGGSVNFHFNSGVQILVVDDNYAGMEVWLGMLRGSTGGMVVLPSGGSATALLTPITGVGGASVFYKLLGGTTGSNPPFTVTYNFSAWVGDGAGQFPQRINCTAASNSTGMSFRVLTWDLTAW